MSNNIDKIFSRFPEFSGDDFPTRFTKFCNFLCEKGGLRVPSEERFSEDAQLCSLIKYITMCKQKRITYYLNKCDETFEKLKKQFLSFEDGFDPALTQIKNMASSEKSLIASLTDGTKSLNIYDILITTCDAKLKGSDSKDIEKTVFEVSNTFVNFRKFLDIIISPREDRLFIRKHEDEEFMRAYREPYENMLKRANAKKEEGNINGYVSILCEDIPIEFKGKTVIGNKCLREAENSTNGEMFVKFFENNLLKYLDPLMRVNETVRKQISPLLIEFFCNFIYAVFLERCFIMVKGFSKMCAIRMFLGTFSPMKQLLYGLPNVAAENMIVTIDDQEFGNFMKN